MIFEPKICFENPIIINIFRREMNNSYCIPLLHKLILKISLINDYCQLTLRFFLIYPYIFYFLLFFFIVTWRRREVTFCTHKKSGLLFILHLVITCIDENEWHLPQIEHRTCSSMSKWGNILTAFWILSKFLQPVRFCTYKIVI